MSELSVLFELFLLILMHCRSLFLHQYFARAIQVNFWDLFFRQKFSILQLKPPEKELFAEIGKRKKGRADGHGHFELAKIRIFLELNKKMKIINSQAVGREFF